MWIKTKKGNVMADISSVFVSRVTDKATQEVKGYNVVGTTFTNKNVTLARCSSELEAQTEFNNLSQHISCIDMASI